MEPGRRIDNQQSRGGFLFKTAQAEEEDPPDQIPKNFATCFVVSWHHLFDIYITYLVPERPENKNSVGFQAFSLLSLIPRATTRNDRPSPEDK